MKCNQAALRGERTSSFGSCLFFWVMYLSGASSHKGLRPREVKWSAQGHTASRWLDWNGISQSRVIKIQLAAHGGQGSHYWKGWGPLLWLPDWTLPFSQTYLASTLPLSSPLRLDALLTVFNVPPYIFWWADTPLPPSFLPKPCA